MKISLRRRHALTVADDALSQKIFQGDSESQRASKSHYWFKSYVDFAEWVDFARWWSFIWKGLRLKDNSELYNRALSCQPIGLIPFTAEGPVNLGGVLCC